MRSVHLRPILSENTPVGTSKMEDAIVETENTPSASAYEPVTWAK